jgi:hypothetical protein
MTLLFQKNKLNLIGITLGALAGFLYWKFVGCSSGTCMITSKPINSTLYGALMGYVFTKPKLTDLDRFEGVFSSRRGLIFSALFII